MSTWKNPKLKRLARAILSLDSEESMLNFLRDLCTLEELDEFSHRWEAVELLNQALPYREIALRTGLSTTTITRIAHWLHHGEGGYELALRQLGKRH